MIIIRKTFSSKKDDEKDNSNGVGRVAGTAATAGLLGTGVVAANNLNTLGELSSQTAGHKYNVDLANKHLNSAINDYNEASKERFTNKLRVEAADARINTYQNSNNKIKTEYNKAVNAHNKKGFFGRMFDSKGRKEIRGKVKELENAQSSITAAKKASIFATDDLNESTRNASKKLEVLNDKLKIRNKAGSIYNNHLNKVAAARHNFRKNAVLGLAGTTLAATAAGVGKYLYNKDKNKEK